MVQISGEDISNRKRITEIEVLVKMLSRTNKKMHLIRFDNTLLFEVG